MANQVKTIELWDTEKGSFESNLTSMFRLELFSFFDDMNKYISSRKKYNRARVGYRNRMRQSVEGKSTSIYDVRKQQQEYETLYLILYHYSKVEKGLKKYQKYHRIFKHSAREFLEATGRSSLVPKKDTSYAKSDPGSYYKYTDLKKKLKRYVEDEEWGANIYAKKDKIKAKKYKKRLYKSKNGLSSLTKKLRKHKSFKELCSLLKNYTQENPKALLFRMVYEEDRLRKRKDNETDELIWQCYQNQYSTQRRANNAKKLISLKRVALKKAAPTTSKKKRTKTLTNPDRVKGCGFAVIDTAENIARIQEIQATRYKVDDDIKKPLSFQAEQEKLRKQEEESKKKMKEFYLQILRSTIQANGEYEVDLQQYLDSGNLDYNDASDIHAYARNYKNRVRDVASTNKVWQFAQGNSERANEIAEEYLNQNIDQVVGPISYIKLNNYMDEHYSIQNGRVVKKSSYETPKSDKSEMNIETR